MPCWGGRTLQVVLVVTKVAAVLGLLLALIAVAPAGGKAEGVAERPRGAVEDCSSAQGWPAGSVRAFRGRSNVIVGPLALQSGARLPYADAVGGNKLFVHVRGGHRVTLELPLAVRRDVGLAFGTPLGATRASRWNLRNSRRVVSFSACDRGTTFGDYEEWPVTGWVGFLLASSPRCVPLLVWVDDEPVARRTVIRFGVPSCD